LLGSHLLLHLTKAGHQPVATYRSPSKIANVKKIFGYTNSDTTLLFDRIKWIKADILDIPSLAQAFQGITQVYHCAALISFDPKDYKKLLKSNIEGTANVVNQCIEHQIKKMCYVSSIAAIGPSIDNKTVTENTEWSNANTNGYAVSKHAAELEVWRGTQEGVPAVIVNPGVILGPGFWKSGSGLFFKAAYKPQSYSLPNGTGFVTVQDVVTAMTQLLDSEIFNERFILVNKNWQYHKLSLLLADMMEKKAPTKILSASNLAIMWRLDWLRARLLRKKRRLSKATVQMLLNNSQYDNTKIKTYLPDFEFEDLEAKIKQFAAIYLEEREP